MTLLERLRQVCGDTTRYYVNPDGPEAADEIERLRDMLQRFTCDCKTKCWVGACATWEAKQLLKGEKNHEIHEITGYPV